MIINMLTEAEKLQCNPPDLITRPVGRAMFEYSKGVIPDMRHGETLLLNFAGIKVIDSSFIDEMIVTLLLFSRESAKEFYVKLRNFSEIAGINIDFVLRSYSNYKNKKIVVITENICRNNVFFIGPLSDKEKGIVEYLRINKSVTPDDAAGFSGLPLQGARKMLDELYAMRIVKKDSDGVFFAV